MNRDDKEQIWRIELDRVEQVMGIHLKHIENKVKALDERLKRLEDDISRLSLLGDYATREALTRGRTATSDEIQRVHERILRAEAKFERLRDEYGARPKEDE